jgi:hypothetical protein
VVEGSKHFSWSNEIHLFQLEFVNEFVKYWNGYCHIKYICLKIIRFQILIMNNIKIDWHYCWRMTTNSAPFYVNLLPKTLFLQRRGRVGSTHALYSRSSVFESHIEDGISFHILCSVRWLGHVERMEDNAMPKRMLKGRLYSIPTTAARVQTRGWWCGILWWPEVALGQVFSENFGFPCQSTFHLLLDNDLHYHPRLAQ